LSSEKRSRREALDLIGTASLLTGSAAVAQPLGFTSEAQVRRPGTPAPNPANRIEGWAEAPPHPRPKQIIIWGDHRNVGKAHTSTSHAMATIERLGYESGLWDSFIRSDSDMITYNAGSAEAPGATPSEQRAPNQPARNALTLADADAIFFIGQRDIYLSPDQKADLIRFVRDEGKGFVAGHAALTAFSNTWPEFVDLIGGYFFSHPYDGVDGPGHLINEDPMFPAMKPFPAQFDWPDEYYIPQLFSRDKIRVLLRMDVSTLPARHAFNRADNDFPVAWAKMYGKGRVFYNSFGHSRETWDHPAIHRMYIEAMKWATGMIDADVTPRPAPPNLPGPKTKPVILPPRR
jgi:type 1 glutamine amidotransferase